ncbi:hypothetical protein POX_d05276 [Penicillium oxalicum]|uniref:hypothetical protein n=1 Tax=Penicillium oxalicum TaxID=69781 RepID=UPI0020B6E0EE|nr:hypothetical protein POX_d05276 [Penicillium oxalicum]KAI2789778.1 hypothetical protein POX_d05276 [Penicillium oxalicum]
MAFAGTKWRLVRRHGRALGEPEAVADADDKGGTWSACTFFCLPEPGDSAKVYPSSSLTSVPSLGSRIRVSATMDSIPSKNLVAILDDTRQQSIIAHTRLRRPVIYSVWRGRY